MSKPNLWIQWVAIDEGHSLQKEYGDGEYVLFMEGSDAFCVKAVDVFGDVRTVYSNGENKSFFNEDERYYLNETILDNDIII
jgi:hypothetical protein